jgi:hypothetical protein
VSFFQAVRLYSALELMLLTALVVVAVGGFDEDAERVLGWSHGIGWILLCLVVGLGCSRRVLPWPLLAATVSPLGPLGSTIGLEILARRRSPKASAGGVRREVA